MKCIKVYPILKKTFSDSLTYWINEDVEIGNIIEAPLQNKNIWVVIDSIISVNEAKEFIKSQDFKIRKIEKIKKLELFSQEFIFSVLKTSNYYIKPFGEVFSELIPKKILESLTDGVDINNSAETEINVFPIQEYLQPKTNLENKILPIDLYKIDNNNVKRVNVYYLESEYYMHLFKKFDYRYFIREFCIRKKIILNEIETVLSIKDKNLYIIEQNTKNKTAIKKKNLDNEIYKDKLSIISPELFSALKKIEETNESIFLYTLKKGFASQTICPDCKHVMKCSECSENLEIEVKGDVFKYRCSNNHKAMNIDSPCPVCFNPNLLSLGASIEVIYKEIKKEFNIDIIKIDNESHTKTQVKKILKDMNEDKRPAIIIGNDFLLNQAICLDFIFDNIAIISLESLFSIPMYNMEYDIYKKVALISNQFYKNLIIQTRDIDNIFWKNIKENKKDVVKVLKNDEELEELNLPPHSVHIQISIPTEKSKKTLEIVKNYLDHNQKYFETEEKIKTTIHILLDKNEYLKNPITQYIKSLPAYIKVEVDSRNLL